MPTASGRESGGSIRLDHQHASFIFTTTSRSSPAIAANPAIFITPVAACATCAASITVDPAFAA